MDEDEVIDDVYVEEEFIRRRGCHVYNATLIPGDTVYVPTGALHGNELQ